MIRYTLNYILPSVTSPNCKIILRARQNFLFEKFRSETTSLSSDLISQIRSAWTTYFRNKVGEGLPDGEKPPQGKEEETWSLFVDRIKDKEWKQGCLMRDEKFDMHFSAAVSLAFPYSHPDFDAVV